MNRTLTALLICSLAITPSVSATIQSKYQEWAASPVRVLMTEQERKEWAAVKTDADAEQFIERFWARRDPTPDTPLNELRQQIEQRIEQADKRFRAGRMAGGRTDRGQVYVLLGEPSEVTPGVTRPAGSRSGMRQFQRPINVETWSYRNEAARRAAGTDAFEIAFVFSDEKLAGEFELNGQSRMSFDSIVRAMARSALSRPAGEPASKGVDRIVALRLIVVADGAIAKDVLRRAQEGEDFRDLAKKYSSHRSAAQGGYLGRVAFAELDDDFKAALAGKDQGSVVLITRTPFFAIVRFLTDAEATAADAETSAPK